MKVLTYSLFVLATIIVIPAVVHAADATDLASRDQRISGYMTSYPVKLSDKEKTQLISVCAAAQSNLQKIDTRLTTTSEERGKVYSLIDSRLDAVQKRLSGQNIDTSAIDLLAVSYRKQTANFDSSVLAYRQTLRDASTMDCAANPAGFRSAVEAVRVARKLVADNSAAIRITATDDLKTTFDLIKKRLSEVTN